MIQAVAHETIPSRFPFEYSDLGEHEVKIRLHPEVHASLKLLVTKEG